jgi:hypothetical protein
LSLVVCVLGLAPLAHAQQLVPLVTDKTPMAVSDSFAQPGPRVMNQAGDYAFLSGAMDAVYLRMAGAAAPIRVFQVGQAVPDPPDSRGVQITVLRINDAGSLAFAMELSLLDGQVTSGVFVYEGGVLRRIASGDQVAPGTGGAHFERGLNLLGLNVAGDVLLSANLVPLNTGAPLANKPTIFFVPHLGAPNRIAGFGDAAPGIAGATIATVGATLNEAGEVLLSAGLSGGPGGTEVLAWNSGTGLRKIVGPGDSNPLGGTFVSTSAVGVVQTSGNVLFRESTGSLFVAAPDASITALVVQGSAAPAAVGGTFGTISSPAAVKPTGEFVFLSTLVGSGVSPQALFRFRPGNPVDVAAYRNQVLAGSVVTAFSGTSINSAGAVGFIATAAAGPIGIFSQSGVDTPVAVVTHGQATALSGGGAYDLSQSATASLLDNGSVFVGTGIVSGADDYADFLFAGGVPATLLKTTDTLPAGSQVLLANKAFGVGGAGDFVGFFAHRTGGKFSVAVHDIANRATTVVATEGEIVPGSGNRLALSDVNSMFVSAAGLVVLRARLIGGPVTQQAILAAGAGAGLSRIVVDGDLDNGGRALTNPTLNSLGPRPLNQTGQIVFRATARISPVATRAGVFVGAPGAVPGKVAIVGDVPAGGTAFTAVGMGSEMINASGQVLFRGTTAAGVGIYVGSPGVAVALVARVGQAAPGGGTFTGFSIPAFNDSGEVVFMATTSGAGGGIFQGSTTAPPVALALNGAPAPAGGNFSITTLRADVSINNQHDVILLGDLVGGTSNAGYFIRRGADGALGTLVLQGDPAPGTATVFSILPHTLNSILGEFFQLSEEGEVAFRGAVPASGLAVINGYWHARVDGTIEELLVRGTVAPEFGDGTAVIATQISFWNTDGRYPMWAGVVGGTFENGVFLFVPVDTTSTSAGSNVVVAPHDTVAGDTPVTITFDTVAQTGETSVTTSAGGPAVPNAFALGDPPLFFNLVTTAVLGGAVTACMNINDLHFPPGSELRLLHFKNGVWEDVTTFKSADIICGRVDSLSPFTVAQQLDEPPVADAGGDQTVEATSASGASVTLDGTASTDPDHDTLTYLWTEGGTTLGTTATLALSRALGPHTMVLTVTDPAGMSSVSTTHVTVVDTTPPHVTVPGPTPASAPTPAGVSVTFPASAVDLVDGALTPTCTPLSGATFALGATVVTCSVMDASGNLGSAQFTVTVTLANRAPVCSAAVPTIAELWPANHQLVTVGILGVTDPDHDAFSIRITGIFQDEPSRGLGDGDQPTDGFGIGSSQAQLRAERAGQGNGRVYHVSFTATDDKDDRCSSEVLVSVPHDHSRAAVDDGPLFASTDAALDAAWHRDDVHRDAPFQEPRRLPIGRTEAARRAD